VEQIFKTPYKPQHKIGGISKEKGFKLDVCFPMNSCVGAVSRLFLPIEEYSIAATKSELCNVTQNDLTTNGPLLERNERFQAEWYEECMKQESPNVMICPERKNSWRNQLETITDDEFMKEQEMGHSKSTYLKLLSKDNRILKHTLTKINKRKKVAKKKNCKNKKFCSKTRKASEMKQTKKSTRKDRKKKPTKKLPKMNKSSKTKKSWRKNKKMKQRQSTKIKKVSKDKKRFGINERSKKRNKQTKKSTQKERKKKPTKNSEKNNKSSKTKKSWRNNKKMKQRQSTKIKKVSKAKNAKR